jgi:hypothetical protein
MIPATVARGKSTGTFVPVPDTEAALTARIFALLDAGEAHPFAAAHSYNATLAAPMPTADLVELIARESAARASAPPEGNKPPRREVNVSQTLLTLSTPPDSPRAAPPARSLVCAGGRKAQEEEDRLACLADMEAGRGFRLELRRFLPWACEYSREMRRRSPGWQSPLFWFVRALRGHYSLAYGAAEEAAAKVDELLLERDEAEGGPRGPRHCCWERYLGVGRDDAIAEVLDVWGKVRQSVGRSVLIQAYESAVTDPLPVVTARSFAERYADFVSLAGWLQVGVGRRPIVLPQREVAGYLCVQQRTVSRYAEWAEAEGYLRQVEEGKYGGAGKKGRAGEYLFDVSRFPQLEALAEAGTAELFRGEGAPRTEKAAKAPDPAAAVVEAYHRLVGSHHIFPGEAGQVRVLLNAGVPVERLMRAVEGYAAVCERERGLGHYRDPQYRGSMMAFFSTRGGSMWESFAEEAGG